MRSCFLFFVEWDGAFTQSERFLKDVAYESQCIPEYCALYQTSFKLFRALPTFAIGCMCCKRLYQHWHLCEDVLTNSPMQWECFLANCLVASMQHHGNFHRWGSSWLRFSNSKTLHHDSISSNVMLDFSRTHLKYATLPQTKVYAFVNKKYVDARLRSPNKIVEGNGIPNGLNNGVLQTAHQSINGDFADCRRFLTSS